MKPEESNVKHRYNKINTEQSDDHLDSDLSRELPYSPQKLTIFTVLYSRNDTPWERRRKSTLKLIDFIRVKLEAIAWIAAAAYCIYSTSFFKTIFDNPNVNKVFLSLSLTCLGINIVLACYVTIILPYVLRIPEPFETYSPRSVQLGAMSGFIGMTIAIWPVWGWWSFPMLFVMFMGFLSTGHFLPDNVLGSLLFGLIFVGATISHHFIEHDGSSDQV